MYGGDTVNIGERIKYLRKDILHIKSQEVFAKQINISRSNLGNIETSRVSVTDRVISDICSTYNVNESWLRNGGSDDDIFISKSENSELFDYVQDLLKDTDDVIVNGIKDFIVVYNRLDKTSQAVLQNVAKEYLNEFNKHKQDSTEHKHCIYDDVPDEPEEGFPEDFDDTSKNAG